MSYPALYDAARRHGVKVLLEIEPDRRDIRGSEEPANLVLVIRREGAVLYRAVVTGSLSAEAAHAARKLWGEEFGKAVA